MNRVNDRRVIIGGALAGAVLLAGSLLLGGLLPQGLLVATPGAEQVVTPDRGIQLFALTFLHLFVGCIVVWLYAAIRPRYGAGPLTAVRAGLAVWMLTGLVVVGAHGMLGLYRSAIIGSEVIASLAVSAIFYALAGAAGGWQYREEGGAARERAAPQPAAPA